MGPRNEQSTKWTCKFCGRAFDNAGDWWSHNCDDEDAEPVTPAQRDVVAILSNVPDCQIEKDGDCLWA